MIGRLTHAALAAGRSLAILVAVGTIGALGAGCYDVPRPACGFVCGPGGACPAAYTCNTADNRCRLDGTPPDLACPSVDAGVDAPDLLPYVLQVFPADGTFDAPLNVTPTATFSEDVTGVSGATFSLATEAGEPVASNVTYNIATRTASLDPDLLLATNTGYVVTLSQDIEDLTGNPLLAALEWRFRTGDPIPPMVTMVSPTNGATGVGVDTILRATFSEEVSNVIAAFFAVEGPDGPITGLVGYEPSPPVGTFAPTVQLAPNTTYTATLTDDIRDFWGNPLLGAPFAWSFTTGPDTVGPAASMRSPAPGATDVADTATVSARFDEPVLGVSAASVRLEQAGAPVLGTVTYTESTRTARLSPDVPLAPSTAYTVTLTAAITDAAGNPLAGAPVTWTFTTAP